MVARAGCVTTATLFFLCFFFTACFFGLAACFFTAADFAFATVFAPLYRSTVITVPPVFVTVIADVAVAVAPLESLMVTVIV